VNNYDRPLWNNYYSLSSSVFAVNNFFQVDE